MSDTKRLSGFIGKRVKVYFLNNEKFVVGVLKRLKNGNYELHTGDNNGTYYIMAKGFLSQLKIEELLK